ncbi:MAG TPA: hypothetical protein VFA79_10365 [Myxococcales bacterium]|nr:hypothetical protein [Myxococcales bacterium]
MPAPSVKSSLHLDASLPRARTGALTAAAHDEDEFSAGETLADGFRAWLSQLPVLAGCALLLHAPLLAFAFLPDLPEPIVAVAFVMAGVVAAGLVQGALVKAVLDHERSLPSDLGELLQAGLRVGPRAVGVHLAALGGTLARLLMLVKPGVHYLCDTFVAVPALAVDQKSMQTALLRSTRLARGARLRIFLVAVVPWTTAALVAASSGAFGQSSFEDLPWLIAFIFARALDTSLAATLAATTYSRLSSRPGN